jgi:hypothetical protein
MTDVLEEVINHMEYLSFECFRSDWTRFVQFLRVLGHRPMTLPDKLVDVDENGEHNFVLLFCCLPARQWSLYFHTPNLRGHDDIFLLWREDGEERVIHFNFVERAIAIPVPTVHTDHPSRIVHRIPLEEYYDMTVRFLYLWYFLNRINIDEPTVEQPLPSVKELHLAFKDALHDYRLRLASEYKKRTPELKSPPRAKRVKVEMEEGPFPEFDGDSGYARFFTPQTLTKYVMLLDTLQKAYPELCNFSFFDLLVKVQSERLYVDKLHAIKKPPETSEPERFPSGALKPLFRSYFPSGSPKPPKLRNLAGFLFELFRDLMACTSEEQPHSDKVIFGTPLQQDAIILALNSLPRGSLIDIVSGELGDKDSLWRILYRYLSARRFSDLTVST